MIRSYTSTKIGAVPRISEAINLYRAHSRNVPGQVNLLLQRIRDTEEEVRCYAGRALEGLDVLEIKPRQTSSKCLRYSGIRSNATGIDLDYRRTRSSQAFVVEGSFFIGKPIDRRRKPIVLIQSSIEIPQERRFLARVDTRLCRGRRACGPLSEEGR